MSQVTDLSHEVTSRPRDRLEEIRVLFGDDEETPEKASVDIDRKDVLRDSFHDEGKWDVVADGFLDFLCVAFDVSPEQFAVMDIGREFELQHLNLLA
ncbi:MAG: hypothetical protein V4760_07495 [Bdellovibrionota bacterium]